MRWFSWLFKDKTQSQPPLVPKDWMMRIFDFKNEEQKKIIKVQLELFVKNKHALLTYDKKIFGTELTLYGLIWYLGFAGFVVNNLFAVIFIASLNNVDPHRKMLMDQFKEQLNNLQYFFRNNIKIRGEQFIQDALIVEIFREIAPYIKNIEKYIPEKFNPESFKNEHVLRFVSYLSKPPHQFRFFIPHGNKLVLQSSQNEKAYQINDILWPESRSFFARANKNINQSIKCFNLTRAEIELILYGNEEKEIKLNP